MGVYRQIKVDFWLSSFVLDLSPMERSFYLYLLTNPATTQCGIFKLSIHTIQSQFGSTKEEINILIDKFVQYRKIIYSSETKEFLIVNWMEHNRPRNPKMEICTKRELGQVCDMMLLETWKLLNPQDAETMKLGENLDTVSIPYAYRMDTVFSKLETWCKNKNKKKKEKEEEKPKEEKEEEKEKKHTQKKEEETVENVEKKKKKGSVCVGNDSSDKDDSNDDPSDPSDPQQSPVEEIIGYLNEQSGSNFSPSEPSTIHLIENRMECGYSVLDFKKVIDKKCQDWEGVVFSANLTPYTLFGEKFETYLRQKTRKEIKLKSMNHSLRNPVSIFTNTKLVEV